LGNIQPPLRCRGLKMGGGRFIDRLSRSIHYPPAADLQVNTVDAAAGWLACGLDPKRKIYFARARPRGARTRWSFFFFFVVFFYGL